MGKGIILRVLAGTQLSPELTNTLTKLIPGYTLQYYKEQPDYQESIKRRIDSLYNAFLFILKATPPDPKFTPFTIETLKAYALESKDNCNLTKNSLSELHPELERFTARLVEVLASAWRWPEGKEISEAIEFLNEAEQYALMIQGRPDLATLTSMKFGDKTEYVLQLDESIPPYYDQWLIELREIKRLGYPKTPVWFRELPEYQKAYFCNLSREVSDVTEVAQDLNAFYLDWTKQFKSNALKYSVDLKQISNDSPPYPSWYNDLKPPIKAMVRVLSESPGEFDKKLEKFKQLANDRTKSKKIKNLLKNVTQIPEWYWVLSEKQQCFLEYALKNTSSIEDAVSFLSSRHRTLPAPANFAAHSLYRINTENEISLIGIKRWRSSHVASRDVLKCSKAVQERHCSSNFAKVTEQAKVGQTIGFQTLISPITAADYVPHIVTDMLPELPDLDLYRIARRVIARSNRAVDIFQHNHPYNIAKRYYYTETDNPDSVLLLKEARKFVLTKPGLQDLLTAYKGVLESPVGSATFFDYEGRELFLSSLEQMIIYVIGGYSYGSCVSGKDRKAVELIHSDAMLLFYERYGTWPRFGDPKEKQERILFVEIVVELYCSRHQHEHAGQNAPGSEGIKNAAWYFPKDIAEAINKRLGNEKALEYSDRLASDNEVSKIDKQLGSKLIMGNELSCKLMAYQLGEADCTRLYDGLSSLIGERDRFKKPGKDYWTLGLFSDGKKESGPTPKGIQSIEKLMKNENAGSTNVQRIERIFLAVLSRPEKDDSRTPATNSVYDRLRDFFNPKKADEPLQKRVNDAVDEWLTLFEESKVANSISNPM